MAVPLAKRCLHPPTFMRAWSVDLQSAIDVHYMVNYYRPWLAQIDARHQDFSYAIHEVPPVPAEFLTFMQEQSGASDNEMYGNFNMGAGFAIYLPSDQAQKVVDIAAEQGLKAWIAGSVEAGPNKSLLSPKILPLPLTAWRSASAGLPGHCRVIRFPPGQAAHTTASHRPFDHRL